MIKEYVDIVYEAGRKLLDVKNLHIEEKTDFRNLVTSYDLMIQEYLVGEFGRLKPDACFLCEEGEKHDINDENGLFIIDPIDGTANFVHGYNMSAISAAYAEKGEIKWGIVYNPYTDEMFQAEKGTGAKLNGSHINVSSYGLKNSIVAFGTSPYNMELKTKTLNMVSKVMEHSMDVRRSGSAALDLCYVAAGRVGLFFEMILSPWDYAAGMIMIHEAGGIVLDFDMKRPDYFGRSSICAGNPVCMEEYRAILEGGADYG